MSKSKGKEKDINEIMYGVKDEMEDEEEGTEWVEPLTNAEVQQRTRLPWENLEKAQLINGTSSALLRDFDGRDREGRLQLLDGQSGTVYVELFLQLLGSGGESVASKEVIQYILASIDEIVKDDERCALFFRIKDAYGSSSASSGASSTATSLPFRPFLDVLRRSDDWFINSRASRILATLLAASPRPALKEEQSLVLWCVTYMRDHKDSIGDLLLATQALQIVLRRDEYRVPFGHNNGIEILERILKQNMNSQQLIYRVLFCMWVVSFNDEVAAMFSQESYPDLIPTIVEILRKKSKLKLRRLCLAILRNLMNKGAEGSKTSTNNVKMIEAGIIRVLGYLNNKKWGDEDIESDLESLTEELQKDVNEMTSFEVYNKEVRSGKLTWSPVHKSEKFWRENVSRFEENNKELIGILLGLIRASDNPTVLAVALYDIGEFVRFHPRGRKIVNDLEGKEDIMLHMTNEDPEVQKHALLCVQKMMVHNWEYLNRNM